MKYELQNNQLIIYLEGRIVSDNAADTEKEIEKICSENEHTALVLDAANLQMISSAGLRIILKLKKEENNFKVINASSEVYEVFTITGFTEMMEIDKAFRELSVENCTVIGEGAKGIVYRYDGDTIIKVIKNPDSLPDIKRERELARKAFILGIPTAISFDIVKVNGLYGSVFELLDAKSMSELIAEDTENIDKFAEIFTSILKQIHSTQVSEKDMPDVKELVHKWVDECAKHLSAEQTAKIEKLVSETPDTMNMLHCDYHTNNIMMQNGQAMLIDMDNLCHGHPVFELANIYLSFVMFAELDQTMVEKFLGLNNDICVDFWGKFFSRYFEGYDNKNEIMDKIELLSRMRLLRHISRRGIKTEQEKSTVEKCKTEIGELLCRVDSLAF